MSQNVFARLQLHRLRKIEIVVHAEDHSAVEELLKTAGVGGWTMIRDVAGMGHGGFHQGRTIFNDHTGLVMFVGVAEAAVISEVAIGLSRLFESRPGVTFLSDVEVMRSDYFASSTSTAA
ncbi:P-II family nitrogen regulator [Novosphingobium flavum]|uniref:Nitrogen regulatory protein P-II n=1 Tax=Novosphingobium aerophilum TaxID=2839843 RepID=A0A7X1F6F4_9SPHN|nr:MULTISPECIES: P-II family nitrogen regulator [Novosphingobium]MBC2651280.1 P-II family nitrogen regulator [Novosphingobium aerophilum]MBC2661254.1 P-II family nitrogen regulator [Novosphingobium aerophilum]